MTSIGIFDLRAIRQSCWQTCNADPGSHPMDLREVPTYRDANTAEAFYSVATVFGCAEVCEGDYEKRRILLLLPTLGAVLLAVLCLIICLLCWFCKGCWLNNYRKQRRKHQLMSQSSTPGVATNYKASFNETRSTLASFFSARSVLETPEIARQFEQAQSKEQMRRGRAAKALVDLDASMRSNVSVNSWMRDSDSSKQRRKESLMKTATKLGKKLAALDRRSEDRKSRHRSKSREEGRGHGSKQMKSRRSKKVVSQPSPTGILNPPMRF